MKKALLFVVCCSMLASASAVTKDDPSITVTGEAKVRAPADRAYLIFHTEEDNKIAANAIEQAWQDMQRALDAVARKTPITIHSERLNSMVEQDPAGEFVAAHSVRVSCAPNDQEIFDIIDDACSVYASLNPRPTMANVLPILPVIYAVEEYEKIEQELEQQALDDARARAEKLAQRAGKILGEIISLESGLIPAKGRDVDLPTPYISNNRRGVMMVKTMTATWQLLPKESE